MPKYTPEDYCAYNGGKFKKLPILCWYDEKESEPFIMFVDDWYSDKTAYFGNGTFWSEWPKNLNWKLIYNYIDKSWEPEDQ